jgi:glycosyltransferase involved in cell wall biosynthesis
VIDVVLPVLNEAEALPWVLARIPVGYRPLVVDNGSTDDSAAVAADAGATLISESRPGFGAACWAGLRASQSAVVCFMDADGSLDPHDLPAVSEPVWDGRADLVLGARQAQPGAWPWHARVGNRVLAHHIYRRCGVRLSDLGPMRAARRHALLSLGIQDRRFGWPLEMVIRAGQADWRVHEVTVPYRSRRGGESKVSGSVRGTIKTVWDMSHV